MKALIVDDNLQSAHFAQFMLSRLNCEADLADSGNSSLSALQTNYPDLIILDWNMPELNGYETLVKYDEVAKKHNREITIAIYTGCRMDEIDFPLLNRVHIASFISKKMSPIRQFESFQRSIRNINKNLRHKKSYSK